MSSLAKNAVQDFLFIVENSFRCGLISESMREFRLMALKGLVTASDWATFEIDEHWDEGFEALPLSGIADSNNVPHQINSRDADQNCANEIFRFIPDPKSGMSSWEFHQYDRDYFPSVPHGHNICNQKEKLDPYLGWKYMGSRQVGRESRQTIIALWNEDDFRKFAKKAIQFYLDAYPKYHWRIQYPLRLPKKR